MVVKEMMITIEGGCGRGGDSGAVNGSLRERWVRKQRFTVAEIYQGAAVLVRHHSETKEQSFGTFKVLTSGIGHVLLLN